MKFEIDEKDESVKLYKDSKEGAYYETMSFKEFEEFTEDVLWRIKNPQGS